MHELGATLPECPTVRGRGGRSTGLRVTEVVSIPVSDVDRAKAFYADTLGFTLNIDNPVGDGMRWVQLTPPGGGASVAPITWNADDLPLGAIKEIYLRCDDSEGMVAALAGRGVQFTQAVFDTPFGTFARFNDPDGNRLLSDRRRDRGLPGGAGRVRGQQGCRPPAHRPLLAPGPDPADRAISGRGEPPLGSGHVPRTSPLAGPGILSVPVPRARSTHMPRSVVASTDTTRDGSIDDPGDSPATPCFAAAAPMRLRLSIAVLEVQAAW